MHEFQAGAFEALCNKKPQEIEKGVVFMLQKNQDEKLTAR